MSKFRIDIISDKEGFAVTVSEHYLDEKGNAKTGLCREELYRSVSALKTYDKFRETIKGMNKNMFKCTSISAVVGNTYCIYEPLQEFIWE